MLQVVQTTRVRVASREHTESMRAFGVAGVFAPQVIGSVEPIAKANERLAHSLVEVLACTSGLLS